MFNGYTWLIVGGTFDANGGKPSGFITKLAQNIERFAGPVAVVNGGNWHAFLTSGFMERTLSSQKTILFWAPNVSNEEEKLLPEIKRAYPETFLVTTKRNYADGDAYTRQDLVKRALASKSNLLVEFTSGDDRFLSTVIDPLGNVFVEKTPHVERLALTLVKRMSELVKFTRVSSRMVGDAIPAPAEEEAFYEVVRHKADQFHEVIHGVNVERFLGNASFRCTFGFPSMRREGKIFVTRRNIDKRFLNAEGFVALEPEFSHDREVQYYGQLKPSVDTPVQLMLYRYFRNVTYMVHSHTYVLGAEGTTASMVPCGALEEFLEIVDLVGPNLGNFSINLRGHGSIIFASDLDYLRSRRHVGLHEEGVLA